MECRIIQCAVGKFHSKQKIVAGTEVHSYYFAIGEMCILQTGMFQNSQREITPDKFTVYEIDVAEVAFLEITIDKNTIAEFIVNELLVYVIDLVECFSFVKFVAHVVLDWNKFKQ
jgi:hypothetical protein